MPAAATRSILVQHTDGHKSIIENIPGNAKITLGPVSPGKADYNNRDIALRIYTTLGNQLAVFRDVSSFRDLSLVVKTQEVKHTNEEVAVAGPQGSKRKVQQATEFKFVVEDF